MGNSREKILEKIKQALTTSVPLPFPQDLGSSVDYPKSTLDNKKVFEETFAGLQGEFYSCENENALPTLLLDILKHKNWNKVYCKETNLMNVLESLGIVLHQELASCDVCITDCEALVSRTGSIVLSAAQIEGRTASVYAPAHISIASVDQICYDIGDAITFLQTKYDRALPSFLTFASGPSRTADIEKTLVTGVHGPKEVTCILIG